MEVGERISQLTRLAFDDISVDISSSGGVYAASLEGRTYRLELIEVSDGRISLLVDDRQVAAYVSSDSLSRWVTMNGRTFFMTRSSRRLATAHDGSSELIAPMPGQVRTVNVSIGDAVIKGQVLVVLEAMKMEIRLHAPFDGTVSLVDARLGQTVEREQVLVKLQAQPAHS